ncbi:MAG: rod shape-determining protein MreC [Bacteroidota bacterium]
MGLEIIALYLVTHANDHQRHLMGDAALKASSNIYRFRSNVSNFFSLKEENQQLMDENILLRTELVQARRMLEAMKTSSPTDSLKLARLTQLPEKEPFFYLTAHVIKNSTHHTYNYITLDKGSREGVKVGMGVVSPKGIVGKVIRVTLDYSLVLSALNVDFKLPLQAIIAEDDSEKKSVNIGFYEWKQGDPRFAELAYIPETVKLKTGYQVVTSGYSTVFPAGYLVGKISELENDKEDGYHKVRLELSTDFDNLGNVYLIEATHSAVMDSLSNNLPTE